MKDIPTHPHVDYTKEELGKMINALKEYRDIVSDSVVRSLISKELKKKQKLYTETV